MTTTLFRAFAAAAVIGTIALAGCGDGKPKVSEIAYKDIKAMTADEARMKANFSKEVAGKYIVWSGKVVESKEEAGDDFAIITKLYVDMDGDGSAADVSLKVLPGEAKALKAGADVKFRGTITEYRLTGDQLLILLEGARLLK